MKVYISGPISGTNDYMQRFENAEIKLLLDGYTVINPALVNSNLPTDTTHAEYMQMSFCMLDMCNAIYMLNGWQKSKGAVMEHNRAERKHLKIFYEDQ